MNFLISGYNEYTKLLIHRLNQPEHNIYIIAKNIDENIASIHDIYPINGIATDITLLNEIKETISVDYYISIDLNDEINITSSLLIKKLEIASNIITFLSNPIYTDEVPKILKDIGSFVISKDEINNGIIKLVSNKNIFTSIPLFNNSIEIIGTIINNPLVDNISIENITSMFDEDINFRILFIERENSTIIPKGNDILKLNDKIYLFDNSIEVKKLITFLNEKDIQNEKSDDLFLDDSVSKSENIVILGNIDNITKALKVLIKKHNITVLTKHVSKFNEIDIELSKLNVIDIRNEKINEIDKYLKNCDIFIANETSDELNFISAIIAKHNKIPKIIPFIKNQQYNNIYNQANIFYHLNIYEIAIYKILNIIKDINMLNIATFNKGLEIFEAVMTNKKNCNKKIKELKLPNDIIIGIIIKDNKVITPIGDTVLEYGDKLTIIAFNSQSNKIKKILEK